MESERGQQDRAKCTIEYAIRYGDKIYATFVDVGCKYQKQTTAALRQFPTNLFLQSRQSL